MLLADLLRHRAEHEPDRTAYVFLEDGTDETERLSYGALDARARAVAALLQERTRPGDRVLLLHPPGLDFVAAFYGCFYAGTIAVPTYPPVGEALAARVQAVAADAEPAVALTVGSARDGLAAWAEALTGGTLPVLDSTAPGPAPDDWHPRTAAAGDVAFLQYTSGSTGAPKGVMVSHANLVANLRMITDAVGLRPDRTIVSWLPLFHDMGLIGKVMGALYSGAPAVLMPPWTFLRRPIRWLEAVSRYRGYATASPNFGYELCVRKTTPEERADLDLSSWGVALNGAEPVRARTLERFAEAFAPHGFRREALFPTYGLAEATLFVSGGPAGTGYETTTLDPDALQQHRVAPSDEGHRIVGCGSAGWGEQEVAIVDPEARRRCAPGEVGEVWVAGPHVAQGYWSRPEATAETFDARIDGEPERGPFLRTGDLGFLRDGDLFVTGRLKDLLIVRGRNHYPQDVEAVAEAAHPALRPGCAAAFAVEEDGEERLVVVQEVYRRAQKDLDGEAVAGAVREAVGERAGLAAHAVVLIEEGALPKTSSGKVQRRACRRLHLADELPVVYAWTTPEAAEVASEAAPEAGPEPTASAPVAAPAPSLQAIRAWLMDHVAAALSAPDLRPDEPLARHGADSMDAVAIAGELSDRLGHEFAPSLVYDYPTVDAIARHAAEVVGSAAPAPAVVRPALPAGGDDALAVVGMSVRFPGAPSLDAFWDVLREGRDVISEVPPERWPDGAPADVPRWAGLIEGVDGFDPLFFGISPREAPHIDPQQRLVLEVAWEALEHAGIAPSRTAGSATGVFIGIGLSDYAGLTSAADADAYSGTGNALCVAANRLSYTLDWRGPSMAIDTACSSSLVAIHQACQSLRTGDCDLALAGGVNLILSPRPTATLARADMLAADGRCKTFDASADGYVRAEGCGIVVLRRLAEARAAGDRVLAVVLGSAVNQDGRSNGLTAPNGPSQRAVIRTAWARGGVAPEEVGMVEAHGTGTPLGDPIEADTLKAVLADGHGEREAPCWLGSVKTNMGHAEAAAGVAGFIKTVLALHHEAIPPHLHLQALNPHISLDGSPLAIPTALTPWPRGAHRRVAAVSGSGFGGTNVHVVLEEGDAPAPAAGGSDRPVHLLTLSARVPEALRDLAARYRDHLGSAEAAFADACFTANAGRSHFDHRLAVVAASAGEAAERLSAFLDGAFLDGGAAPGLASGRSRGLEAGRMATLFTGQGAQYAGMGRALYEAHPRFRRALDRCDAVLRPVLDRSLLSVLYAEGEESPIDETAFTQPALFAVEYALAELWASWGIEPAAALGHSVGEYVAACRAGVFGLEDALRLVAARGRLMQALPKEGAMAAVFAPEDVVAEAVRPRAADVSIAAVNGPEAVVISGRGAAVDAVLDALGEGVRARRLRVSHAFHSPLMEPMLAAFGEVVAGVDFAAPERPFVSNVTGRWAGDEVASADYWVRHVRAAVRFTDGLGALRERGCTHFIEAGPAPTLLGLARGALGAEAALLPSLRPGRPDWETLLGSLGALYAAGADVDWQGFDAPFARRRVSLPTYPFQRSRYWIGDETPAAADAAAEDRLLGERLPADPHRPDDHEWEVALDLPSVPYAGGHRVQGAAVLPTAAYLEMARSAVRDLLGDRPVVLENASYWQPLVLSEAEPTVVRLSLSGSAEAGFRFRVHSKDARAADPRYRTWILHADGDAVVLAAEPPPPDSPPTHPRRTGDGAPGDGPRLLNPLDALRARCRTPIRGEDFYAAVAEAGAVHGPAFRSVEGLWLGDGEVLAALRLPDAWADVPHAAPPLLLEGGLLVASALVPTRPGGRLLPMPLGMGRLRLHRPLPARLWSHAVLTGLSEDDVLEAHVTVVDAAGTTVAEAEAVRLRLVDPAGRAAEVPLADLPYRLVWEPTEPAEAADPDGPSTWLLLADRSGVGDASAEALRARGDRVVTLLEEDAAGLAAAVEEAAATPTHPLRHALYLWALDEADGVEPEAADRRTHGAILLLQALLERGSAPRVWIATRGVQHVEAAPVPLSPGGGPLWGLGRTLSAEHPGLWGGLIDLDPTDEPERAGRRLLRTAATAGAEDQVALRQGRPYAPRLVREPGLSRSPEPTQFRADGTYLITGGLGDLGLYTAQWMAEAGAVHLALLGRTPLPPREAWDAAAADPALATRIAVVRALEADGARVYPLAADVADEAQMRAAVAELAAAGAPPVVGVLHAAGVARGAMLADTDADTLRTVLRPKVRGAWVLHRLFRDAELFVLFSSISALVGWVGMGIGTYAAANAFLDALACYRRRLGLAGQSVSWGPWREIGMAAREADELGALARLGLGSIGPEQAMEVLDGLLHHGPPFAAVAEVKWARFFEMFPRAEAAPFLSPRLMEARGGGALQVAERGALRKLALAAPEAERARILEEHVRTHIAAVVGLAPDQLDPDEPLDAVGLDSLMSMEMVNRLEVELDVTVPLVSLLQGPSTREFVADVVLPAVESAAAT